MHERPKTPQHKNFFADFAAQHPHNPRQQGGPKSRLTSSLTENS
jgi:hypothetical protein